jgi:hypothetical protein
MKQYTNGHDHLTQLAAQPIFILIEILTTKHTRFA